MTKVYKTDTGELYTDNFSVLELRCHGPCCNKQKPHKMTEEALIRHQSFREKLGRAYTPTSAYRCEKHPEESKKARPGQHCVGNAMDVPVSGGAQRMAAIKAAIEIGATGVGVANSFVHVDFREDVPMAWKY